MRCAVSMLIFLAGCEAMPDPGGFASIAKPVDVAPEPAPESEAPEPAPEPTPEPDAAPEETEPHSGHGDDHGTASEPAPAPEPASEVVQPAVAEVPAEVTEESTSAAEASPDAPKDADSTGTAQISVANNWPLRLVKTMPETNPPRAILGLPTGEEIVVNPGTMIPAHRLVVTSIGPRTTDLVLIEPEGDHTAISSISLQTQY